MLEGSANLMSIVGSIGHTTPCILRKDGIVRAELDYKYSRLEDNVHQQYETGGMDFSARN